MRLLLAPVVALSMLGLGASPLAAQTPEEQARLDWAAARGRLLFDLDRAAWVGTDDMLERISNAASLGLRGYIVERDGAALIVTFFGGPEAAPVAFYRGRVENRRVVGREVFPADARPPLTAAQRRLATVRAMAGELARRHDRRTCNEAPFNTAVVPPDTADGPIDLYLLTPQVRADEYPFGGHYRFTIAADGSVASSREFARSCIAFPAGRDERGERPAGMVVTHLLDPIPTEIHVFNALGAGVPVFVGAAEPPRVWSVEGDRIRLVREPSGEK